MPRLAAWLPMLFCEVPLRARFGRAARAGFASVEMQFRREAPAAALKSVGLKSMIEPLEHFDVPGCWRNRAELAIPVLDQLHLALRAAQAHRLRGLGATPRRRGFTPSSPPCR